MIRIYWRPRRVPRVVLFTVALLALAGVYGVETYQIRRVQPHYKEKLQAANIAKQAFEHIKAERIRLLGPIDRESDPAESGLIGANMSPVTSDPGLLAAKQTTVNPNFAAMVVQLLRRAGVENGDTIAVGMSGSFPALNICVYAAAKALNLNVVAIASASSSQWGANHPEFLWLDQEKLLFVNKVFPYRSMASSLGGLEDRGLGMTADGRKLLRAAITERHALPLIQASDFNESVEQRMAMYRTAAGEKPIRAYVNVGGGTVSVGSSVGKRQFKEGLNLTAPAGAVDLADSVMLRFIRDNVPVIHLVRIENLAERYGFPLTPQTMPVAGQGKIFYQDEYNKPLAGGVLVVIFVLLYAFVRSDLGFRLLQVTSRGKEKRHPERMV
ncbi:MAG: hypothetical protein GMKNLPBB_03026 [Myxococcota bacterium]|nr:hypothetical protein [Myxococcota bacterium]